MQCGEGQHACACGRVCRPLARVVVKQCQWRRPCSWWAQRATSTCPALEVRAALARPFWLRSVQQEAGVLELLRPEVSSLSSAVAEAHAKLEHKSGRVFCTALLGEFMTDSTLTWIDGTELRPGVAYMVAPGASIAFGESGGLRSWPTKAGCVPGHHLPPLPCSQALSTTASP